MRISTRLRVIVTSILLVVFLVSFSLFFSTRSSVRAANTADPFPVQETLTVPVGPAGATRTSNTPLKPGVTYTLLISGTFIWGGCDPVTCPHGGPDYLRWGDAGFLTDDHFASFSDPFWSSIVYLEIDGVHFFANSYNPQHAYTYTRVGDGQPLTVTFVLQDCSYCYSDNAGSLRVEIIQSSGTTGHSFIANSQFQQPVQFQQRSMTTSSSVSPDRGNWGDTPYGDPATSGPTDTIERWGCFLTDWAMILDAWGAKYGFHTDPYQLDRWLRSNQGFHGLSVWSPKVAQYAHDMTGGKPFLYVPDTGNYTIANLNSLMDQGIPAILEVNNTGHYVLAVGKTISKAGTPTWYINDPYFNSLYDLRPTMASYNNQFTRIQYGKELSGSASLASLGIALGSPAELLVTDQLGRRTGVDPTTNLTYSEIPNASYNIDALQDDINQIALPNPSKTFYATTPSDGQYIVQVIGTGTGDFHLDTLAYNAQGSPASYSTLGTTQSGEVHTYLINFSSTTGVSTLKLATTVPVDVQPGDTVSTINPKSNGKIPVAILSTANFDATTVDPSSVRFGPAANSPTASSVQDINGDGKPDLLLQFTTNQTGIYAGESRVCLSGQSTAVGFIVGCDSISTTK